MLLRLLLLILVFLISGRAVYAQSDSTLSGDTLITQKDSTSKPDSGRIAKVPARPVIIRFDTTVFTNHPFYHIEAPLKVISTPREWIGKEVFFYVLLTLFLFFAIIKNAFNSYLKNLVKLFLRTSIKDRQVKEQLMQSPLPSLLFNILFLVTGALFLNIVLGEYNLGTSYSFWMLLAGCSLGLAVIYVIKFLTLKLCGWLFQLSDATDGYIFIVFSTNKIIGILLLPIVALLAFTSGAFKEAIVTMGLLLIGALFFYRFFLAYSSAHRQLKIELFHFFLYLCAFEVAPLLLIYKLLFAFLR
ncbi:MAG TPA: DUF4271 domain-containing protein [Flavisolibacter sp.]|nr:DUF4271 domain-containing protein [Flavisolibacter sp.]